MYPKELKKGTRIRVGARGGIVQSAIGVEFVLDKDCPIGEDGRAKGTNVYPVKANPNGWTHPIVTYQINLRYDIVLSMSNNKEASAMLDKEW